MIKHLKISYLSILLTLLAATLGGCVYDDSPAGCGDGGRLQGDVPVRLTLRLDGFGEESRAAQSGVWNDLHNKEIGSRFDSQINRLHVMLIDGSGNLAHTTLRNYMYDADDKGYTFAGNINFPEEGWEAGNYRVMVLANCGPAQLGAKTLTELKEEIDDVMWYNPDGSPRSGILIPMWGATTHVFAFDGNKDKPEDIGSIDLLRAVSKVQIMLDPSKMGDYELVSAKISTANAYINPFPTGWETATATIDRSLRFGSAFNPVSSAVTGGTFSPGAFPDETEGSIVFYLPEYDSATTEATIDVTLRHPATGQTFTYPAAIHFNDGNINKTGTDFPSDPDYPGKRLPTDIVRNHYYQFTIDGIEFGTISYSVNCWNYIPSTLGWAVEYSFDSEDSDARYGYITNPCFSNSKNNEIKNSSSQFTYTFSLTGPEGATWKAFLLNPDGSDHLKYPNGVDQPFYPENWKEADKGKPYFRFAPGNDDENLQKAASTGIAREAPYKIAVDVSSNIWTDFPKDGNEKVIPNIKESTKNEPIPLNNAGVLWRDAKMVPTVYLVIKVALDGENYTEELKINPDFTANKDYPKQFFTYKFAGTRSKIELRQLFIPKFDVNMGKMYLGLDGTLQQDLPTEYQQNVWWNKPQSSITTSE